MQYKKETMRSILTLITASLARFLWN